MEQDPDNLLDNQSGSPESPGALRNESIPPDCAGQRLDVALTTVFPDYSRSRLQEWIRAGHIALDGQPCQVRQRVTGGESVTLSPPVENLVGDCLAEDLPLDVIYQDDQIVVINKAIDSVMHPAAGNWQGTVQNALLFHFPGIEQVPRAGIVHRLDKDTSGLFVVARTLEAHASLVEQLQTRTMGRSYAAIVQGPMVSGGTVDEPIGRHPKDRKRMAVRENGKPAVTHYRIGEKFRQHTLLDVKLETGRTHQIRVHMAHIHHPLIGDVTYAGRRKFPKGLDAQSRQLVHDFPRQALHARKLSLQHPGNGEPMEWETPLPRDMLGLIAALRTADGGA